MILLELLLFGVGFLWFWLRTDAEVNGDAAEPPRLRAGDRLETR